MIRAKIIWSDQTSTFVNMKSANDVEKTLKMLMPKMASKVRHPILICIEKSVETISWQTCDTIQDGQLRQYGGI